MNRRGALILAAILALILMVLTPIVESEPNGANVTVLNSSRRTSLGPAGSVQALAGNVTELNIEGTAVTKYWQGYYGNVTGSIVLGTADGYNLYQWADVSPRGEIFASRNDSRINWTGVGCADSTQIVNEDSFLGANPAQTVDSANRTFNYTDPPSFSIGGRSISGCRSVSVNGTGNGNVFWESLLADNGTSSSSADDIFIYTAIIDPNRLGFNGNTYDFQMLVGEPGNGSEQYPNGNPTTYYFYLELE